jgi:hypothetical protein
VLRRVKPAVATHRHHRSANRLRSGSTKGGFVTEPERNAELAVGWIEAWIRMDMAWLRERLAPDFVHISPFGRLEGRDFYLATVEPMARKSVQQLEVKDVIGGEHEAAVWFENRTASGVIPSCDWVQIEHGLITKIQSFYDSVKVRDVLSPDDQKNLDGS